MRFGASGFGQEDRTKHTRCPNSSPLPWPNVVQIALALNQPLVYSPLCTPRGYPVGQPFLTAVYKNASLKRFSVAALLVVASVFTVVSVAPPPVY